jgi:hypothetical protein
MPALHNELLVTTHSIRHQKLRHRYSPPRTRVQAKSSMRSSLSPTGALRELCL